MKYGFIKTAVACPEIKLGNCTYNIEKVLDYATEANNQEVEILCFPELSITGKTCGDLFLNQTLIEDAELSVIRLAEATRQFNMAIIIGTPVNTHGMLFNCSAVLFKGKVMGLVPKIYPDLNDARQFRSGTILESQSIHYAGQNVPFGTKLLFNHANCIFGIEIGYDLWTPIPPSCQQTLHGAEIIFNPTAVNESIGNHQYLTDLAKQQSARLICAYAVAGSGKGESTQDFVYDGKALIVENGRVLIEAPHFETSPSLKITEIDIELLLAERRKNPLFVYKGKEDWTFIETNAIPQNTDTKLTRYINPSPFIPKNKAKFDRRCSEILQTQALGLVRRFTHTKAQTLVIGISGGLDSTLALLVCVKAFDILKLNRKGIIGITMPGFGTTSRTYENATNLMKFLGITIREISIAEACRLHFKDLSIDENQHDVTYENSQARERTQVLMDAANQMNGLVVGTGDLSELALGWATYNGDHMSMYNVNCSIPKTLVRHLVIWSAQNSEDEYCSKILMDIANTPISPELLPADNQDNISQKTEDLVGPYELHDFFLYFHLRYGFSPAKILLLAQAAFQGRYPQETISNWLHTFLRRFFSQQYKRSCMPDGPKIGSISLSPRGGLCMPSDADSEAWLQRI